MMSPHPVPSPLAAACSPARVLIVKSDRFYGQCLQDSVARILPNCAIATVQRLTDAQQQVISPRRPCMIICGIGFPEGDALSWLRIVVETRRAQCVLIVTTRGETRVLTLLRAIPVNGVFDAFDGDMSEFSQAVTQVLRGGYFLSPSFAERLRNGSDTTQLRLRNLSLLEQRVLSEIGTGSDNVEAALKLGMHPEAVQSHRKRLHRKLGILHKGELIRAAISLGLVRVDRNGDLREGFGSLWTSVPPEIFPSNLESTAV